MSIPRHQTTAVYRLSIRLRGISPAIWRRLLIPVNSTILNLHEAIQAVMGWEDIHLNRFSIRGQLYGVTRDGGMSFFTRPDRLQLIEFGFCEHDRFVYEYDFYSRWIHEIRAKKVLDSASQSLATCIAGVGACPPEDSGPVDHFMQQLG